MAEPSLLKVLERHGELDALFLAHQSALLDRDPPEARRALEVFSRALRDHVEEEERDLLPIYRERAPQPPGGGVELFLDEHRKLLDLVCRLEEASAALAPAPPPKELLALLDRETQFKNLLDHHDRRERSFLYPGLDAVTSPEERVALLTRLKL